MKNLTCSSYKVIFEIALTAFILFSCLERDRSNVFDPLAGIDTLDITPVLRRSDSLIMLDWAVPPQAKTLGYNLYRKVGNEAEFTQIQSLPADKPFASDTAQGFDIPHRYLITYMGEDGESPPSHVLTTNPGPTTFWILDDLQLTVSRFTHDLSYNPRNFFAIWYTESFARDSKRDRGLATFTAFQYIEIFSLASGELLQTNYNISNPYDCLYLPGQDRYWVSDSATGIYSIDPVSGRELFMENTAGKPTHMQAMPDDRVFVLDRQQKGIIKYDPNGNPEEIYRQAGDTFLLKPVAFCAAEGEPFLFIIDRNQPDDFLLRVNTRTAEWDTLLIADAMRQVQFDPVSGTVWISINQPDNIHLVQLSREGIRLKELYGFKYIADFRINPYNNALAVCDYDGLRVVHISQEGKILGETKKRVAPHKVYIQ